jgi:hypothetical protein
MTDPDPSAELERRAEEASVAYERNTAFRAAVVLIPGIGSSLDVLFASEGQRIFRERIHKLIDDMQALMETVGDSALDREYLKSEEFFDLVMRAYEATSKTRDEEKRRLYARILTGSTIRYKREGHSPEEYLGLIADLTPRELSVARALHRDWLPGPEEYNRLKHLDRERVEDDWRAWQERVRAEVGIDAADLLLILNRLRSTGVVTEHFGTVSTTPRLISMAGEASPPAKRGSGSGGWRGRTRRTGRPRL